MFAAILIGILAQIPPQPSLADYAARLGQVQRRYDIEEAGRLVQELRSAHPEDAQSLLLPKALLLVADWQRVEFEKLGKDRHAERRALGKIIDEAAQEGLDCLKNAPESSEVCRLRADFYGAMIRTDFQAKRYRKNMDAAAQRALALDPRNANACVTAAKPYLFADPGQGQDLGKAKEWLDRALELDPGHEAALLLKALIYEQLGEKSQANDLYKQVLTSNPACKPAKDRMEAVKRESK